MSNRTLYILSAIFFLCAGALVFWGIQTDLAMESGTGFQPVSADGKDSRMGKWTIPIINFTASATVICGFGLLALLLYFSPSITALARSHRETKAILVLNLFLGWTVLGWIAALVWSFTSQVEHPATHNPQPTTPQ